VSVASRPHRDLDGLPQQHKPINQPVVGDALEPAVTKGGEHGLMGLEALRRYGLGPSMLLDDRVDGARQAGLGQAFIRVGEAKVGEDIPATGLEFLRFSSASGTGSSAATSLHSFVLDALEMCARPFEPFDDPVNVCLRSLGPFRLLLEYVQHVHDSLDRDGEGLGERQITDVHVELAVHRGRHRGCITRWRGEMGMGLTQL
jgi:hypothetical protein